LGFDAIKQTAFLFKPLFRPDNARRSIQTLGLDDNKANAVAFIVRLELVMGDGVAAGRTFPDAPEKFVILGLVDVEDINHGP